MRNFRLTRSDPSPQCREIKIEGELDLAVSDQLRQAIDDSADRNLILVSLQGCQFIDSSAVAVLLRAQRKLTSEERRVLVSGPSGQVLRLLSAIGLAEGELIESR